MASKEKITEQALEILTALEGIGRDIRFPGIFATPENQANISRVLRAAILAAEEGIRSALIADRDAEYRAESRDQDVSE